MKIPKALSTFVAIAMSFFISNIPATALAESMIPTSVVVADLNRTQAESNVSSFLEQNDVREELMKKGISPDEIKSRLASLSTTELKQLSGQVEQARAGGDILITVLIVVLIIFLIKRI